MLDLGNQLYKQVTTEKGHLITIRIFSVSDGLTFRILDQPPTGRAKETVFTLPLIVAETLSNVIAREVAQLLIRTAPNEKS